MLCPYMSSTPGSVCVLSASSIGGELTGWGERWGRVKSDKGMLSKVKFGYLSWFWLSQKR